MRPKINERSEVVLRRFAMEWRCSVTAALNRLIDQAPKEMELLSELADCGNCSAESARHKLGVFSIRAARILGGES